MITAFGVQNLLVPSVFVLVVDIVEDEKEHYCDVAPLCLFDQLLILRIINCTRNKYSNTTITNHVVASAAVTVELDAATSKVNSS